MHGPSHLLLGWFMGEAGGLTRPRHRRLVAWAGFAPDLDVLAYVGAIVWFGDRDRAFGEVWRVVHHRYTHGLGFVLLVGIVTWLLARRDNDTAAARRVGWLSVGAGVVHLFGDLVAGGADWPLYPYWPVSDLAWIQSASFSLAQWPNTVILSLLLMAMIVYPRHTGRSPMEAFHYGLDRRFVAITRQPLFGHRDSATAGGGYTRWVVYGLLLLVILAILAPLGFRLD